MKVWTYAEAKGKVEMDLDLEDETFIAPDEMAGYFNEGLNEAEAEIMATNQDYLLTKAFLPVVQGTQVYDLPYNIYANKIRALIYNVGSIIYEITRFRRRNKFLDMAVVNQYPSNADWYGYNLQNDVPGQAHLEFSPTMRDTAVLSPAASIFSPITMWYIRNCARIPMIGEFCNPEVLACLPTAQVDPTADTILTFAGTKGVATYGSGKYGSPVQGNPGPFPGSIGYKTGDKLRFKPSPGGVLPAPLVQGVVYFAIQTGTQFANGNLIKVATSAINAVGGTAIDLTTTGSGFILMEVAATTAIRDATLIDIPEFVTFLMQWVKCRCMEKESDPRLSGAVDVLAAQKKQMIDTLTTSIEDDDDQIQADYSHYREMN